MVNLDLLTESIYLQEPFCRFAENQLTQDAVQVTLASMILQVHCVSAFGRLQEMVQEHGPYPQGLILHSWIGPAEMVDMLARIDGVYFSLSGHLTCMSKKKYEPMVKKARLYFPHLMLLVQLVLGLLPMIWALLLAVCC